MTHAAGIANSNSAPRAGAGPKKRVPRRAPRFSGRNRYSLFVGLMKVLLPAMAAALILLVVAWPQFTVERDSFRLGISRLGRGEPENLSMLNARLNGIDQKQQPFTVTADMATQSNRKENLIDLELPKADMTLADGTWLALTARSGQFDRETRLLDLFGTVSLFHDQGFELRTASARIDLEQGIAEGSQPIQGQGAMGAISAEGFRVLERGRRIVFTGRSRLTILPAARDALR